MHLGDDLYLSGKIDRIDVDPYSARGIVQDYKSGRSAHSAKQIDEELKLQIPLYMLVLRDLVGIEPLGGVYRALAGARVTRGLLHAGAPTTCPATSATTTSKRASSGRSSRPPETADAATPSASGPVTSATTRKAALPDLV